MTEHKIDTHTVSVLNPLTLTPSQGLLSNSSLRLKCQPNAMYFPFAAVEKVQISDKASNMAACTGKRFFCSPVCMCITKLLAGKIAL